MFFNKKTPKEPRKWMTANEARSIINRNTESKITQSIDAIITEIEKAVTLKSEKLVYVYFGNNVDEVCKELKNLNYRVEQEYRNYDKFKLSIYW